MSALNNQRLNIISGFNISGIENRPGFPDGCFHITVKSIHISREQDAFIRVLAIVLHGNYVSVFGCNGSAGPDRTFLCRQADVVACSNVGSRQFSQAVQVYIPFASGLHRNILTSSDRSIHRCNIAACGFNNNIVPRVNASFKFNVPGSFNKLAVLIQSSVERNNVSLSGSNITCYFNISGYCM